MKLSTVYHIGKLDVPRRKPHVSYEGDGLSVSLHPEDWRKIARGHVSGDTWELTKAKPKFMIATTANKKKAVEWAVKNGWLESMTRYRVSWFDDEMGDDVSTEFDTLEEAQEEAESYDVEPETVQSYAFGPKGTRYWREAFTSDPDNSLAADFAILWFAEDKGYDGVWWNDKLDPARLSAPRGVIFQSKLPEWQKRKSLSASSSGPAESHHMYHGTSSVVLDAVKSGSGVRRVFTHSNKSLGGVYVTGNKHLAEVYAKNAAKELGGTPVVLRLNVDENELEPDEDFVVPLSEAHEYEPDEREQAFLDDLFVGYLGDGHSLSDHYTTRYEELNKAHSVTWRDSWRWLRTARIPRPLKATDILTVSVNGQSVSATPSSTTPATDIDVKHAMSFSYQKRRVEGAVSASVAGFSSLLVNVDDDSAEGLLEQAYSIFKEHGIRLHSNYDRFMLAIDDTDEEKVAAAAALCVYSDDESVEFSVATSSGQHRRGLARFLIEEVIDYTKELASEYDWENAEVEAYVVNDAAMNPLLSSLGFAPDSSDKKRWRRKVTETVVEATVAPATDIDVKHAMSFSNQSHVWPRGVPEGVTFSWSVDEQYPVSKLLAFFKSKREAKRWLNDEKEYHANTYYEELEDWVVSGKDLEQIILIEDENGKPIDLWDGWHRTAAALIHDVKSLPAIVGRMTSGHKTEATVVSAWLEATDDVIAKMKEFFEHKWKTEKGRPDLTGACIFATAFAAEILGGTPTGNWHHIYLDAFGTKVDLTEAYGVREQALERLEKQKQYEAEGHGALARAMTPKGFVGPDVDPYMVDKAFLRSRAFRETWESVQPRASRWADEFLETMKVSAAQKSRRLSDLGLPITWWHGTTQNFDQFSFDENALGAVWLADLDSAKAYADRSYASNDRKAVIEVELDPSTPVIDLTDPAEPFIDELVSMLNKAAENRGFVPSRTKEEWLSNKFMYSDLETYPFIVQRLRDRGVGALLMNDVQGWGGLSHTKSLALLSGDHIVRQTRRPLSDFVSAATQPPEFRDNDPGLMTKDEFLTKRNPKGETHPESAYDFDLQSMNQDYALRSVGRAQLRGRTFNVTGGRDGDYLIREGDKLTAVVHQGDLYVKKDVQVPDGFISGDTREFVSFNIKNRREVKYLMDYVKLVSDVSDQNFRKYPNVIRRILVDGEPLQTRSETKPVENSGERLVVLNEEGLIVAAAQDEWGATLIAVAKEYRGKRLGVELGKLWYRLNPKYASGGFTPSGRANAVKIWEDRVREFQSNGWYSSLVKEGKITTERVKEILSGAGKSKPSPDAGLPRKEEAAKTLLFVDDPKDPTMFVLYDQRFFDEQDEKYVLAHGFMRSSDPVGTFFFTLDYEKPYKQKATYIALQLSRQVGEPIYTGSGYGDIIEADGLQHVERDGDYVYLTKDIIPLEALANQERAIRKKKDPYQEIYHSLLEMANSKDWDHG